MDRFPQSPVAAKWQCTSTVARILEELARLIPFLGFTVSMLFVTRGLIGTDSHFTRFTNSKKIRIPPGNPAPTREALLCGVLTRWSLRVTLVQNVERYVTKVAPHKALTLIVSGKLTLDDRVVLHRVNCVGFTMTCSRQVTIAQGRTCEKGTHPPGSTLSRFSRSQPLRVFTPHPREDF